MQEKVKVSNTLQEDAKIHDSPTTLDTWVTNMEDALKFAEKWYQNAFDVIAEKTLQGEEDGNTLLLEVEDHAKALKTLKDEVVLLKKTLNHSLQRYMKSVYEVCDQVVEQARTFSPCHNLGRGVGPIPGYFRGYSKG